MSIFENRLALSCKQVGEASAELLEWIDENEALVTSERIALLREFYRAGASAQRLASAVSAISCVGFVGPRRSGKTNLVTALVERGNAPLALRFDGIQESIAFTRQIVPESGRFGASAAIRLSNKTRQTPQNFPILLRLMPMADLIKVLGGAYFTAAADRRDVVPSVVEIRTRLETVLQQLSPAPVPGLREDDVWEVRDYFATRFKDEPVLRALSAAGFWEFLAEHAAGISHADRARLLALVWGELPDLTHIFVELSDALARLGHGREASCALDAILGLDQRTGRFLRRADSILAAQTLAGLGEAREEAIVVRTELGQWVSLSRPVLAALAIEIRLPVKGYASELLEKADLLELPSIEPRDKVPGLAGALSADPTLAGQLFMRSKAVQLFERYASDNELTSLVVCVDPATRKLGELPRLVGEWVEHTHGGDPTAREPNDCGLLVAFTKIDRELGEPVRRGKERRVDMASRVETILREELGREHGWPLEWTTGRPFDAVHLVRNPGAKVKQMLDYDNAGRETGYKPPMLERIERARTEFLASDIAKAHVADPSAVWSEAFELNDGGVTYLGQTIAEVCDMRVKHRQILASLAGLRQTMKDRLQRYYVSDNFALQQSRRHGAALQVVRRIRHAAERRKLGPLIRALQISETELADVLVKLAALRAHQESDPHAAEPAPEAEAFASAAIGHWIESMRAAADAADASRQLHLTRPVLHNLVDELIVGARRQELAEQIARRIASEAGDESDTELRVTIAAMCAASAIGEFVMWLGFHDQRSNSRPRRKGRAETPIFPPKAAVELSRLGAADDASDDRFHADWTRAFMTLVSENAADLRERALDTEQNRRLGQLLMLLDASI